MFYDDDLEETATNYAAGFIVSLSERFKYEAGDAACPAESVRLAAHAENMETTPFDEFWLELFANYLVSRPNKWCQVAWDDDDYDPDTVSYENDAACELLTEYMDELYGISLERLTAAGRLLLALFPDTPAESLKILAEDDDCEVRRAAALNPNTPAESLKILAEDDDFEVREAPASNLNTPAESLKILAEHWDYGVREAVAANPNTPATLLKALATDDEVSVRRAVAKNPFTPVEVLAVLATDEAEGVRKAARNNPSFQAAYDAKRAKLGFQDVPDDWAKKVIFPVLASEAA